MTKFSIITFFILLSFSSHCQELLCDVKVTTENVQQTDPSVFRSLEEKVRTFLNGTIWTSDKFDEDERIQASFYINIIDELGQDKFRAQTTIKSTRPVYDSDYETVMFDLIDNDFEFVFDPYTILEYRQGEYSDNLTAMLAFYAYTIIGIDYDAFSFDGGASFHDKAQDIVNQAATSSFPGWIATSSNNKGNKSKYWINRNLTEARYKPLKKITYDYHRNVLDQLYENPQESWKVLTSTLEGLQRFQKNNRNLPMIYMFFDAKNQEIVNIMEKASPAQKAQVYEVCTTIDPVHNKIYKALKK